MKLNHRLSLPVSLLTVSLLAGCASSAQPEYAPKELVDFDATVALDSAWSESVGNGLGRAHYPLAPIVANDRLFVAAEEGELEAFDAKTGDEVWQITLPAGITSALNADPSRLYVGTRDGKVSAIDQQDGSIEWSTRVSSEVLAAPQYNEELIVVQSVDGSVTALDRFTGEEQWVYSATIPALTLRGTGAPRVIQPVTFAGFANGKLVTLDNRSGQELWDLRVAVPSGRTEVDQLVDLDGQPVLTRDGRLYVTSYNGRLIALDARNGEPLWDKPSSSYLTPIVVGDYLFSIDNASHILAMDANTGNVLWKSEDLEGRWLTSPAFIDGKLVVGDYEGYVHLIDAQSGEMAGRYDVGGDGISITPLTEGKRIFVYTNDGELTALDLEAP
ncbi:outer membrane protein assembly factor BamB [Cobetia marina]|jgi:outer membrane protein assembly factor BamB|uniref:Outer membrane protein assembly factor BamB n=1 Tax=Cobetia marina TaxID=28258 RepID=A0ABU9GHL1_COBMA|nr:MULTISPECIES: outer membrane protein assembly factor BamB [Cobetia]AOM00414.1 outer membrane protein assembly factor BamB [Cobetia marina]AZV30507.1 outer membrane protein assembly factor BamB [Cobetia sp. ICG0124]MDH2292881.1 outer membrane protein assembly factor BamB [Cobetia sp. 10Alg 146]MDH2375271.1 outer membrane protein assembly factor BamB [Cobetia sp. 3AK]MDI6004941.1 outer membrane protein assembly factor BamB [Cobetia pacifica]